MILKENFTVETIISLIKFRPRAMMGGEILSYQKEEVPLFVKHLSEVMPNLYAKLVKQFPEVSTLVEKYSYIGRKAYLHTIRKGVEITKKNEKWLWDGEYLTTDNYHLVFSIAPYSEINIRLKPKPDAVITITDDSQVSEKTKFQD